MRTEIVMQQDVPRPDATMCKYFFSGFFSSIPSSRRWLVAPALALLAAFSLPAQAASNVGYLDQNGAWKTVATATDVNSQTTALTEFGGNGWYVCNSPVTLNRSLVVEGTVNLVLANGCNLTVYGSDDKAAVNTTAATLTIYAQSLTGANMGRLNAIASAGTYGGAGIGGDDASSTGTGAAGGIVTINGGNIMAVGRNAGAGIGGGGGSIGGGGGVVTVNNGVISATANCGAGIGGGAGNDSGGSGGTIAIRGGTIEATSSQGAGIGGGCGVNVLGGAGGTITIGGGTVRATSQGGGAGIGGGKSNDTGGWGGAIAINAGTVTATSSGAAGIGGGSGDANGGAGGAVTINAGTVTATSLGSAGIGGGSGDTNGGAGGTITINYGDITASGAGGAGIGGGASQNAGGAGDTIKINGGTVHATSSNRGAAIGGGGALGKTGQGGAGGTTITIAGGAVTAAASAANGGAGIGGGSGSSSGGSGGALYFQGGTVSATGGAFGVGIGAADNCISDPCAHIEVHSGDVTAIAGANNKAGLGGGATAYIYTFGGTLIARSNLQAMIGTWYPMSGGYTYWTNTANTVNSGSVAGINVPPNSDFGNRATYKFVKIQYQ